MDKENSGTNRDAPPTRGDIARKKRDALLAYKGATTLSTAFRKKLGLPLTDRGLQKELGLTDADVKKAMKMEI